MSLYFEQKEKDGKELEVVIKSVSRGNDSIKSMVGTVEDKFQGTDFMYYMKTVSGIVGHRFDVTMNPDKSGNITWFVKDYFDLGNLGKLVFGIRTSNGTKKFEHPVIVFLFEPVPTWREEKLAENKPDLFFGLANLFVRDIKRYVNSAIFCYEHPELSETFGTI